jgi:hypothetical protein
MGATCPSAAPPAHGIPRTRADILKVIGSSPNAVRMQKVVSFYEKLPRGPAPEPEGKGLLGRYQKKYFGKNASARRAYTQNNAQMLRGVCSSEGCSNLTCDSTRSRHWRFDCVRLRTELLLPFA